MGNKSGEKVETFDRSSHIEAMLLSIRYFEIGRGDNISAVSDDGYAIGEIRFAPYHVLTDGSYDFNDYDPMPDYEEWREEANKN